ncbi:MAG: hypothetical protein FJW56_07635, partial [Actinobacteria bacterium]|nr:hypothetical protein [Actinomycetota bacterium]
MGNHLKSKHRFYNTIFRKGYDRIPVKHYGEPIVNEEMAKFFSLPDNVEKSNVANPFNVRLDLLEKIGDDFRYVVPRYKGPEVRYFPDGTRTVAFPDRGWPVQQIRWIEKKYGKGKGIYLEPVFKPFYNIQDPKELEKFDFPEASWLDYSDIKQQCANFSDYVVCVDKAGPDFIAFISNARGIDNVFMDIATKNPVYLKLMEIEFKYRYEITENTLKAAEGLIDVVHCAEDLGSQNGLIISPTSFDELFAHYFKEMFSMIHNYGARVMLHSCGSVYKLIPRLIDLGLDILDTVQVSAADMDIKRLYKEFGKDICFCGSMDVQTILLNLTPEEIKKEVLLRQELFSD